MIRLWNSPICRADIAAIFNIQEKDERPYLRQDRMISRFDVNGNKFNNCFDDFYKCKV
jgi:hypothetical protein